MAPWIFSRFVLPRLHILREAEPGLTFDFLTVDRFVNLVEEQQDCAIRVGALTDSSNLTRKLADNRRILCAAPSYIKRHGVPQVLSDLAEHQAVCLPWQKDWGIGASMPRVSVTVSNSDILTDAVTQGAGIAIKSILAVASELETGQLVEVLPECLRSTEAPISCLRPPKLKGSRKVDAFVTFASTCFHPLPT
ncbi:substrate binding domain-containing protein [uncultured Roseobacter sp.]|uniref:substrate binding domain-containing protein n=1 Tax=uncultured Roseobacter sp. TaxID=114847 RepID=UPI00262E35CA|nr:substrate binding domain-containing protein [uncultured Roseobacter sp.]